MKTYVLTVSRTFPTMHARKGEETYFIEKIKQALGNYSSGGIVYYQNGKDWQKIHTIRANYPLWKKRMEDVQAGKAIISLRYWLEKPYNSPQIEFARLDKDSGCGVQWLNFNYRTQGDSIAFPFVNTGEFGCENNLINAVDLAKNDGLSIQDFQEWFKKYDLSKPMAIIHFTKFRY